MKKHLCFICTLILITAVTQSEAQGVTKSTLEDQVDVEVTVYNNNLGLIKDTRRLSLPSGEGELRFMDVAAYINPVTVHAKSLNFKDSFSILEQNYEYDLITSRKLLDKYVGKKLKIIRYNQYQDTKEIVDATLLSNNDNQPIFKIADEIHIGHYGRLVLPEIPDNLIAKPTLTWLYNNKSRKPHKLEVSYLTDNISWKADYVVVLNKDDTSSDISGWVTLDNKSGATYKNAGLKLIAGEVQRVSPRVMRKGRRMEGIALAGDSVRGFEEKAFFEYHIYDLQRRTTIKDNQTKQVNLLEADSVKTEKELLVYGVSSYFTRMYRDENKKQPVNVYVKFKNAEENNMGMPLPKGIMRLYKEDAEDKLQFIGEDRIEHTPKDEEVKLKIGKAFDVVVERIQTDYRQITTRLHESEWEITLRNHKDEDVKVGIVEPVLGNWQVISNSHPYKKVDAFTIRFDVDVPKDKEVKVRYRLRVGLQ